MGDSDSEDEQPSVFIERGDQRESFSPEDANVAKAVQKRFSLEKEPDCVFSAKNSKRVEFGNLKLGVIYKLEEKQNIAKQTQQPIS